VLHFGDRFRLLLHKAGLGTRASFVKACTDDGVHGNSRTAGALFDRWTAAAYPPLRKTREERESTSGNDANTKIPAIAKLIANRAKLKSERVEQLLTAPYLSVHALVDELEIDFDEARKSGVTDATYAQWEALRQVPPRLQFMTAIERIMRPSDAEARRERVEQLSALLGRYFLYRRHSTKIGVLREVVDVERIHQRTFASGTYYQWDPARPKTPRRIPFDAFYGGSHVACLAGNSYQSHTKLELTSVQFLLGDIDRELYRHPRGSATRLTFLSGMLAGGFDNSDVLMATRVLLMVRGRQQQGSPPLATRGVRVALLPKGSREHDAFADYLACDDRKANVLDNRQSYLNTFLSQTHLQNTLFRRKPPAGGGR